MPIGVADGLLHVFFALQVRQARGRTADTERRERRERNLDTRAHRKETS
jgi:hypothetical protein